MTERKNTSFETGRALRPQTGGSGALGTAPAMHGLGAGGLRFFLFETFRFFTCLS